MAAAIAIGAYAVAGISDFRTRRVPNVLWVGLLAAVLWSGVTLEGVLGAVLMGVVTLVAWHAGDMGGADVKGLTLLPLAFPSVWPVALLLGLGTASAWFAVEGRDEIPLFVPMFPGIVLAAAFAGLAA